MTLQQHGRLDEAAALFRRVLDTAPEHPRALHYGGVLAHQQGRHQDALALVERSLALDPDRADWHNNLGIILQSAGALDAAVAAYRRATDLEPAHANALSNLGVLLRATGHPVEAEASYRAAIRADPAHVDAYTNLGILLNGLQRTKEAAACYCKVITLSPAHRDARKLLALAHATLGDLDAAVRVLDAWLAEEPDDPVARHMLAACTGREVPDRASDAFIETTFDRFADSFESKLERLSYRAPALVSALARDAGLTPANALDILDAGCGTGLCGADLAPFARRLTGIDLSSAMLDKARAKRVYDALVKAEITAYLRAAPAAFDLVVSADALVYVGDLAPVLAAAAAALRPGGLFVFTLEDAGTEAPPTGYRLEIHGRYSHSAPYVERLLEDVGLRPVVARAKLRMEAGVPVAGLAVRALKPTTRSSA